MADWFGPKGIMTQPAAAAAANNASSEAPDYWERELNRADHKDTNANGEKKPALFLKAVPRPEPYKLRPVDKPTIYRQHWIAFKDLRREDGKFVGPVISPAVEFSEKDLDIAWAKGGYEPDKKYADLFINRETGRLVVAQLGPGVFKGMIDYMKETGICLWGDEAPDWQIRVTKAQVATRDGKTREKTEYKVVPLAATKLTEEEKNSINDFKAKVDWKKYFVRSTPEFIKSLYDQLPEDKKVNKSAFNRGNKRPGDASAPPASAPAASAPVTAAAQAQPAPADTVQDDPSDNDNQDLPDEVPSF